MSLEVTTWTPTWINNYDGGNVIRTAAGFKEGSDNLDGHTEEPKVTFSEADFDANDADNADNAGDDDDEA